MVSEVRDQQVILEPNRMRIALDQPNVTYLYGLKPNILEHHLELVGQKLAFNTLQVRKSLSRP